MKRSTIRWLKSLALLGIVVAVIVWAYKSGKAHEFSLQGVKAKSVALQQSVQHSYIKAVVYYCLLYILLITLTLPVVGPLTILGGFLFGLVPGFIYALISACVGSVCSFLCMRYFLISLLRKRYIAKLDRFNDKISVYGYTYLLTLQLLSVVPYVVINMLAALTEVPLKVFVWTTIVGSIPLTFMYALAGQQLGTIESMQDVLSPNIITMLVLLALLALVMPNILKRLNYGDI